MKTIKHALLFSVLLLFSCGDLLNNDDSNAADTNQRLPDGDEDPTNPDKLPEGAVGTVQDLKISTYFQEQVALGLTEGENKNDGLFFSELEIVAYMHRPNETLQSGCACGGWGQKDWSHWVVLQSGHDAARDVVLKRGERLDMSKLNAEYEDANRPEMDFMREVKEFRIDMFEVNIDGAGVLYDGSYYGRLGTGPDGQTDSLYKYPEFTDWARYNGGGRFPGIDDYRAGSINVFFARKDWFPEPVSVVYNQEKFEVVSSSKTLTDEQKGHIESMVRGGTSRRFYNSLLFVPYDGPIVIKFPELDDKGEFDPFQGKESEQGNGESSETAATTNLVGDGDHHKFDGFNLNVVVNFDLSDMVNVASSDFNADPVEIHFNLDDKGVPFKLDVRFYEKYKME